MLHAYASHDGKLVALPCEGLPMQAAVWVDLIEPSLNDQKQLEEILKAPLDVSSELEGIEASARFFETNNALHIRSCFFYEVHPGRLINETVSLILQDGRLISIRERDFPSFKLYLANTLTLHKRLHYENAYEILLGLLDTKVEQAADLIESSYAELERVSHAGLERKADKTFEADLERLAKAEDVSNKVRWCLMDTQRALNFLIRKARIPVHQLEPAREVLRDIDSLAPHNEGLFQRINFLLGSAVGFIDLEQNRVMKQLTILSTIFLAPNLIAAMYGMNFQWMPFLSSPYGFFISVVLMLAGVGCTVSIAIR